MRTPREGQFFTDQGLQQGDRERVGVLEGGAGDWGGGFGNGGQSLVLAIRVAEDSPHRGLDSTGKVSLSLFQPGDLAERVGDGGAKAADEDKADRDDVQFCELVGGEGEGDLVEQEARGEERGVDCPGEWSVVVGRMWRREGAHSC